MQHITYICMELLLAEQNTNVDLQSQFVKYVTGYKRQETVLIIFFTAILTEFVVYLQQLLKEFMAAKHNE